MNCKPGDLAVVVRSVCGNEGKICRVLRASELELPDWVVEFPTEIEWEIGQRSRVGHAADTSLRPIRDSDGPDETLAWAGKPNEVTA